MQANTAFDFHSILDVASPVVMGAVFIAGLMIKNSINEMKQELVANQTKAEKEFSSATSTLSTELQVHIAQDEAQFNSIGRTLTRMDTSLQHLAERH